jgi:hypothetical protein
MSNDQDEQALAELMIDMHGAKAIGKAQDFLYGQASVGNGRAAAKWLRVMTLIEFADLRRAKSAPTGT